MYERQKDKKRSRNCILEQSLTAESLIQPLFSLHEDFCTAMKIGASNTNLSE